jgi:hypothetical protein
LPIAVSNGLSIMEFAQGGSINNSRLIGIIFLTWRGDLG